MTCGAGFPVVFEQTQAERIEVALWKANKGALTWAVLRAIERYQITLGVAMVSPGRFSADEIVRIN